MSRSVISLCLIIFLFLCTTPVSAKQQSPQSLRELILLGLETNLGLQAVQLNIPISQASITVEDAVFDAEFFASAGYSDVSTPISSTLSLTDSSDSQQLSGNLGLRKKLKTGLSAAFSLNTEWVDDNNISDDLSPRYRTSLMVDLVQPLMRGAGTAVNSTSLQLSRNTNRQASLESQFEAQVLALQIEAIVSRLVGATEVVQLRLAAQNLAEELVTANQRRFDAGVIPVSELQETQTALADRLLNVSLSVQDNHWQFEELNQLLEHKLPEGFDVSEFYDFTAEVVSQQLPAFEPLYAAALQKRLDLKVSDIDIDGADLRREFYRNQLKPQLDLKFQAGINGLSGEERSSAGNSYYTGEWTDSFVGAAETDGYQWGVAIDLSVPLGNRAAKARLRQAELQKRQVGYRKQTLEATLKTELRQRRINLLHALEQVKIAEEFERLAEISLNQEQRRLDEGLSDTFRLLSFQDKMINAKIGRVDALVQYYGSIAQMNFYRGIILEQHQIYLENGKGVSP